MARDHCENVVEAEEEAHLLEVVAALEEGGGVDVLGQVRSGRRPRLEDLLVDLPERRS